jgi:hypothetical protein
VLGSGVGAGYGRRHSRAGVAGKGVHPAAGLAPGRWPAMSVVTERLEQRGAAFEVLPHSCAT